VFIEPASVRNQGSNRRIIIFARIYFQLQHLSSPSEEDEVSLNLRVFGSQWLKVYLCHISVTSYVSIPIGRTKYKLIIKLIHN
jgi:hypothetical protein